MTINDGVLPEAPGLVTDRHGARLALYAANEHPAPRPLFPPYVQLARRLGWPDVETLALLGQVLHDEDVATLEDLLHQAAVAAEASGDETLIAAVLARRATVLPGQHDGDLARAVVLLERAAPSADRPAAFQFCAHAYHRAGLWELALEMLDRTEQALRTHPVLTAPVADYNRRALTVNRHESLMALACARFEVLDHTDAAGRLAEWDRAVTDPGPAAVEVLPAAWQVNFRAVDSLVRALAGEPELVASHRLLDELARMHRPGAQACVLAGLAVRALDAGDRQACVRYADAALDVLDPDFAPALTTLCLQLAAASDSSQGWQRYARRQAELRWQTRLTVLHAARRQIEAERALADNAVLHLQVYVDELTGLANRHAFARHLDHLDRVGSLDIAVLMIDLDRFKLINDTFGHVVGDAVLREVGLMLRRLVEPNDLAVRAGGDEFVVLLHGPGAAQASERGQALVETVRGHPWHQVAPGLTVTVSVGVAIGTAPDAVHLQTRADHCLYQAKHQGRGRVVSLEGSID